MGTLLLAMSDFLDPGRGPEQTGDFEVSPGFFFAVLGLGFLLGLFGHIFKVRIMVATGVLLIFLATVALPIFVNLTN